MPTPLADPLPFGLREVWLYPISAAGVVGTGVPLPNAMTFTFSETESFAELKAGDSTVAEHGDGAVVEWKLESGGIPLSAYSIMAGGTLVSAGVSPAGTNTYTKLTTDSRPYFQVQGRAISDSGGDVQCIVYRCKADGALEGEFAQGAFRLQAAAGKGFGDLTTKKLYEFLQSETAAPLTSTAAT